MMSAYSNIIDPPSGLIISWINNCFVQIAIATYRFVSYVHTTNCCFTLEHSHKHRMLNLVANTIDD